MLNTLKISGLIIALATSSLANADIKNEVGELQAYTVASANHTAVIYYTKLENNKYEVVTTVGSNPGVPSLMTQHRVTLEEGQSFSFALDQGLENDVPDPVTITASSDIIQVAHK